MKIRIPLMMDALFVSAVATPGNTYIIDFPSGLHGAAGVISFADGHVIIHKWLDKRTYSPQGTAMVGGGGTRFYPAITGQSGLFLSGASHVRGTIVQRAGRSRHLQNQFMPTVVQPENRS